MKRQPQETGFGRNEGERSKTTMISEEEMSALIMEKNKAKRNEAIGQMTEEDAKHFLKKLLSVMNRSTEK